MKIKLLASQIADWIFLIRLTGDMNIVRRRIEKIRPQVADPEAAGARGCSPLCGCNLLSLDSHSSRGFDTSVSKASPNANQSSKSL